MFQIPYGTLYYRATEPSDACNMSGYFENRNCTINNLRCISNSKKLRNELKELRIAHFLMEGPVKLPSEIKPPLHTILLYLINISIY